MNRRLKVLGMTAAVAMCALQHAVAQEKTLPLAEARAQIGAVVADPASMTAVMKQLAPADQAAFLADVNTAVSKMPGANEEKAAKFLNINKAALKGSAKGNLANLIAEVFATVPPEALTFVSERFAEDLFNRNNDPSRTYSDDSFRNIAQGLLEKIESRTEGTDDATVRNTLAIAMLVRSSNGGPSDLPDVLAATIPDPQAREKVVNEWLPAALAENPDYDALLAEADVSQPPSPQLMLALAGPQVLDAYLADVASSLVDPAGRETTPFTDMATGGFKEAVVHAVEGSAWGGGTGATSTEGVGEGIPKSDEDVPWNPTTDYP